MEKMAEALKILVGRDPTAEEVSKFHRIKDTLGLAEHDAMWTVLLAFGHYESLYEEIPNKIKEACAETVASQRALLEPAARAVEAQLFSNIEQKATRTVDRVVAETIKGAAAVKDSVQRRRLGLAIALSIGIAAIVVLIVGYGAFEAGRSSRNGEMAWLDSAEGQAARRFARLNDVKAMLACEDPLSRQQSGSTEHCVPYDRNTKQIRMWRIN